MTRFVHTIQTIYSETRLLCDGSYGPLVHSSRKESKTPNGGSAILQLLKKDTPYGDVASHNTVSPVDVRTLLRREFNSPGIQEPIRVPSSVPEQRVHFDRAGARSNLNGEETGRGSLTCFSQEDVRQTLTEMLLSDQFISQCYERLMTRSRN